MRQHKKPGYVLVLTLMIVSILVIIATRLFYKASAYSGFSTTILNSQKAKQLALSGVQLAISRMLIPPINVEKDTSEEAIDQAIEEKFVGRLFPVLNMWQEYKAKDSSGQEEGLIKYYIACENGKLNLNQIYRLNQIMLKNGNITDESNIGLEEIANFATGLKKYLNGNYLGALQEDFNKIKYPYNDVSQLLRIPQFEAYFGKRLFVDDSVEEEQIFLMDLFTIFSHSIKIQPLLFSNALIKILGLTISKDPVKRAAILAEALKTEPPSKNASLEERLKSEWTNLLQPIYGVEIDSLPKNAAFFLDTTLMPDFFSIISYAKVGNVTKKLYAIVQLRIIGDNELSFDIIKLYWIS